MTAMTSDPNPLPESDEQLLERVFSGKDGDRARALFETVPNTDTRKKGDDKELLLYLVVETQDPKRLEQLVRTSARVRPKWDKDDWLRKAIGG